MLLKSIFCNLSTLHYCGSSYTCELFIIFNAVIIVEVTRPFPCGALPHCGMFELQSSPQSSCYKLPLICVKNIHICLKRFKERSENVRWPHFSGPRCIDACVCSVVVIIADLSSAEKHPHEKCTHGESTKESGAESEVESAATHQRASDNWALALKNHRPSLRGTSRAAAAAMRLFLARRRRLAKEASVDLREDIN